MPTLLGLGRIVGLSKIMAMCGYEVVRVGHEWVKTMGLVSCSYVLTSRNLLIELRFSAWFLLSMSFGVSHKKCILPTNDITHTISDISLRSRGLDS